MYIELRTAPPLSVKKIPTATSKLLSPFKARRYTSQDRRLTSRSTAIAVPTASCIMKQLLIRLAIFPYGTTILIAIAMAGIAFPYLSQSTLANAQDRRDDFPDRRRGGGTHWVTPDSPTPSRPSDLVSDFYTT